MVDKMLCWMHKRMPSCLLAENYQVGFFNVVRLTYHARVPESASYTQHYFILYILPTRKDYFQAIYNYSYLLQFLGIRRYLTVYVINLYASGIKVFSLKNLSFLYSKVTDVDLSPAFRTCKTKPSCACECARWFFYGFCFSPHLQIGPSPMSELK